MSNILDEALEDTKLLRETAFENAKNNLIEALSADIKQLVERQIGENDVTLEIGAGAPGSVVSEKGDIELELDDEDEENEDMDDMDEMATPAMSSGLAPALGLGEAKDEEDEEDNLEEAAGEDEMDEVVDITNEDLKAALSEAVREVLGDTFSTMKEAKVTKSFGEVQDTNKGSSGLLDKKGGEKAWEEETAPASKDWTVKEAAYREKLKSLAEELVVYKKACSVLKEKVREVNLFSRKLLYANKLMQNNSLNNKQKLGIIEQFDKAQTVREVELVYESLSEISKSLGLVSESRKIRGAKASRPVGQPTRVLNESADGAGGQDWQARMQQLAGLVK